MTAEDVRAAVEEIRRKAWDNEQAHALGDRLWKKVLEVIRDGAVNGQELAAEALKTEEISFSRWRA